MLSAPTRPREYPVLDSLRGIAILGVIMVHAGTRMPPSNWVLAGIASQGGWGVQLFFILSALTLVISWRSRAEDAPVPRFLLRRFFRVAPMFYLAITFELLTDPWSPRYYAPYGLGVGDYVATYLFMNAWLPNAINSVFRGAWSIGDEVNFYLLFPFLVGWVTSLRRAVLGFFGTLVAGGLLVALFLHAAYTAIPNPNGYLIHAYLLWWLPSQLPVFLIGFLVYFLAFEPPTGWRLPSLGHGRLLMAVSVAGCVLLALPKVGSTLHLPYAVLFGVGVYGVLLAPPPWLEHVFWRHIGKVSYSAYFLHFYVLGYTHHIARRLLAPGNLGFLAYYLAATALTVAAATVTYALVERPGIAVGRRLAARLAPRPDGPASPGV